MDIRRAAQHHLVMAELENEMSSIYIKRHNEMLEYQKRISPFTPTIRELQKLWGLNTTSAVIYVMEKLVNKGLVISRKTGKSKKYFAIESNFG